ncbi:MAG TPA: MoaD/ThiS family protein [Candidatus Polarisedimenticolia bacterium]|nr:MoaD/ThiS family protein [Candidatus Polarisedimenticolia bacterium]
MKVRVLLFARLRELARSDALELELPEGSTAGSVWLRLQEQVEALRAYRRPPLMAIDQAYVSPDSVLAGGEEVAFFPPVSGG